MTVTCGGVRKVKAIPHLTFHLRCAFPGGEQRSYTREESWCK